MKEALSRTGGGAGRVLEDAAEGALAGLAATAAMSLFTAAVMTAVKRAGAPRRAQERLARASPEGLAPTEQAAAEVEGAVLGRRPSRREREAGGELIHWTFGVVLGAVYGLLSSRARRVGAGSGLAYGAAVFAGASEAALPALGLSLPPSAYPAAGHALNLASHLVYGAALDASTRGLRSAAAALR